MCKMPQTRSKSKTNNTDLQDEPKFKSKKPNKKVKDLEKCKISNTEVGSSSSESDIENYLEHPDNLDFNSAFFKSVTATNTETQLAATTSKYFNQKSETATGKADFTDSDSDTENQSRGFPLPNYYQYKDVDKSSTVNQPLQTKHKVHTKQIESVSDLLKLGEKTEQSTEEIEHSSPENSSDYTSNSESDGEDWQEVGEKCMNSVHPQSGKSLQIAVDLPGHHKRKRKQEDVFASIKRRINRVKKENQILAHKVHLLCWIAHGTYVNKVLNNENVLAIALSLIPSENCYPPSRIDTKYLGDITKWYRNTIKSVPSDDIKCDLEKELLTQFTNKRSSNKRHLVFGFVALLRALGIQCRLVLSFQVISLRPPDSILCSLSTKNAGTKSKSRKSVNNSLKDNSISKETNSINKALKNQSKSTSKASKQNKQKEKSQEQQLKTKERNVNSEKCKINVQSENCVVSTQIRTNKTSNYFSQQLNDTQLGKLSIKASSDEELLKLDHIKSKKSLNDRKNTLKRSQSTNITETEVKKRSDIQSQSNSTKSGPSKRQNSKSEELSMGGNSSDKKHRSRCSTEAAVGKNVEEIYKEKHKKKLKLSDQDLQNERCDIIVRKKVCSGGNKNLTVPTIKIERRTVSAENYPTATGNNEAKRVRSKSTSNSNKQMKNELLRVKLPRIQKKKTDNIQQLDGNNDSDSDNFIESPSLYKKTKLSQSPTLKHSNNQNSKLKSASNKNVKELNTSKYFQGYQNHLKDIRDDIKNLMVHNIKEHKVKDLRNIRKRSNNVMDSGNESDDFYLPSNSKKTKNSDIKVKRRVEIQPVSENKSRFKDAKTKSEGINWWVEVFLECEGHWLNVDVVSGKIHCVEHTHKNASQPIMYILAWNNNNTIKDVTKRYCRQFHTVTRKLRVESDWWRKTLTPFVGISNVWDKEEDAQFERQHLEMPLPKTINELKDHPLYVLRRHLLKFQGIYPADAPPLGFVRNEPIYSRQCVYLLHSRDIWLKHAKVVKLGEKPYKIVKARPKYDKLSNTIISDQLLEIFGPWQTEDYVPPTAENGVVPRNAFGNVELFKTCMLPKKTVHLQLPGLNRVARKLNIDCAPAIVGFDFHSGWSHPTYDGFVVCEEFKEILIAAWENEQEEIEKREQEKIEKRVYDNWRRLIKGLLIREKLQTKYEFGEKKSNVKSSKKVTFVVKNRQSLYN